ncbi:GNAT family N-acetyltransferase [Fictibacillus fluitans]|uniref:GNAT family N-acetyltransferase n=1 Tax=Fictibacillus fluitans TaxID=3058422 RepID=A0ABT8HUW1_9BACL|nr:GNAT family N-acetyltransferase [Fictibacillus sp. NE201]MDN4524562.1 GNAT family N-acetyltransferase [Fictibacillus sp. NE201]
MKVKDGTPEYILIEPTEEIVEINEWKKGIVAVLQKAEIEDVNRVGITLHRNHQDFEQRSDYLIRSGFEHYASKVDVYRELDDMEEYHPYTWRTLEDHRCTEEGFMELWGMCMQGSDNAASTLSMEQHLQSVKLELGFRWKHSCRIFYQEDQPIGIAIPHIEQGTTTEGRLFYFGVLQGIRSKGTGTCMHRQALTCLKEMGAKYYVGSTHQKNLKMQRVFQKNGCHITGCTESYYKYY